MLPDIEIADDLARSQRHSRCSSSKKSKKKKGLRLSLQRAPEGSDPQIKVPIKPPAKKIKPLVLNDSWEDMKPIRATSHEVKRTMAKNINVETSDNLVPEKPVKSESVHSSRSIKTSSSSGIQQ